MSLLDHLITGVQPGPRKILLHGTAGIGKSTFASMAPSPVFIQTEDGLRDIDATKFPLAASLADVMQAAWELSQTEHRFNTLAIDSLDWLERLIFSAVAKEANTETIEEIPFGKGYATAVKKWMDFLSLLDVLHADKEMNIILIAHSEIIQFSSPDTEPYDRYIPRLNKRTWPIVCEWASEVLFATYKVHTKKEDAGFSKTRFKGIGSGERVLRTTERPAHVAKNRLNLPDELPLDWRTFSEHLEQERKAVA